MVLHAPTTAETREIERRFQDCEIKMHIRSGMRLKELNFQDSYSYELADLFVGASSQRVLMRRYREILRQLDVRIGGAR